jgi:PAS domain S-box-containing protein
MVEQYYSKEKLMAINILLIGEDQDTVQFMRAMVSGTGGSLEIDCVDNLASALDLLAQGGTHVILLDLALSAGDGLEMLGCIQRHSPNLPIIVMTPSDDETLGLKAMQLGAQEYLSQGEITRQLLVRAARYAIERKRAEAAWRDQENERTLRKSEEHFRALIEHSWDGVLLLTPTGEMLYSSPSTRRILGHVGDELITQNAFALMHPDDLPSITQQFQLLLTRPEETFTAEFRYQHKDGSWRWMECTATNLLADPSVQALVVNYREITERRTNEAALRQARVELEQRVEERTTELVKANDSLRQQIIERKRAEAELQERNQKLAQLYEEVQAGRKQLQKLSHRLVEVQEQERRAISRELHDEVGQILTGLKMTLELTRRLPPESIDAAFDQAQQQVNELLSHVRNLSLDLRPAMLDDLGLLPALFWHFDRYTAQTKVRVDFKHLSIEGRFAPELETAIYRIVQEALTNVARHSRSDQVTVLLWTTPETICVQIEDQGVGFTQESVVAAGHSNGLTGMRERAALLGGKLVVESSIGGGTCLTAELPMLRQYAHSPEQIIEAEHRSG